jgi:hypothetical protein
MGKWEEQVMKESMHKLKRRPRMFRRFVDDMIGRWKGSEGDFVRMVEISNSFESRMKVTWEICRKEAVFLDARVQ